MANELLDFVMSLVRDPNAAAAYADNPAQAIADAHLTDVTSADVNNLIPVVSESLSMAAPPSSNVWTSGAATAAFDAFDTHVPVDTSDQVHTVATNLIQDPQHGAALAPGPDAFTSAEVPAVAGAGDPSLHFDAPVIDDAPALDTPVHQDWSHSVADDHHVDDHVDDHHADDHHPDPSGFDIFDS